MQPSVMMVGLLCGLLPCSSVWSASEWWPGDALPLTGGARELGSLSEGVGSMPGPARFGRSCSLIGAELAGGGDGLPWSDGRLITRDVLRSPYATRLALAGCEGQLVASGSGVGMAAAFSLDATTSLAMDFAADVGSPPAASKASGIDYDGDGDVGSMDLRRAAQNPVADLISLPLQNNLGFDTGRLNHEQNVLNIQPVVPINLDADWNLITRSIVPVIYQPSLFEGDEHDFGIGDVQFSAFLAPVQPVHGWIVGAGPTVRVPSATDARLGSRKWAVGASLVALRMEGSWVFGGLVQNVWSVAGSGDRNYSEFLVQPFVNYNLPDGWYLTSSPIITANWQAESDERWVVPVGGGVGKLFEVGSQPVNVSVQGFYNIETPTYGSEWTVRIQLQMLFPK